LKPNDINFCTWLRNAKKLGSRWIANHGNVEKLRNEYNKKIKIKKEENNRKKTISNEQSISMNIEEEEVKECKDYTNVQE
jgi:hypothetical protein